MSTPSLSQLHRAVKISEQIQSLEAELHSILGTNGGAIGNAKRTYTKKSAAVVSEGPTATDAVIHPLFGKAKRKYTKKSATSTESPVPAKKKRKKGQMSEEGRARIIAAQKARWAKVKKAKK